MLKYKENEAAIAGYDQYPRDTWLEVDLGKFKNNIEIIKNYTGKRVMLIVKANAYGYGLVPCALAAQESGAAMLGIATAGEAGILRQAGITIPLLRVTAYGIDEIETFIRDDVHFFIWTKDQIERAGAEAAKAGKKAKAHLKIDTGMGRAGVLPEDFEDIARTLDEAQHVDFEGLCSHFHSADVEDPVRSQSQMKIFDWAVSTLKNMDITPEYVHLANSPGLLRFKGAHHNMVRSGVITYGMPYERGFDLPEGVEFIARWKARLVSVKTLPPGHGVSYEIQYVTSKEEKIGIIPVGYTDGFHRFPKNCNEVLLHGRKLPVVGRICMDQCMIVIPDDIDAKEGDEVILFGKQGDAYIDPLDIADKWGTNNYDVVAGIRSRVPRRYI